MEATTTNEFRYLESVKQVPYCTLLLFLSEVIVYMVYVPETRPESLEWSSTKAVVGPLDCRASLDDRWRLYPLLCYQVVHLGLRHVTNNALGLLVFGGIIESVHGAWRVFAIFQVSVVNGAMAFLVMNPESRLIGSSGGVYGLMFCQGANLMYNWREMYWVLKCARILCMLIFIGGDLSTYLTGNDRIAYACHAIGGVTGFLTGALVLKNLVVERYERWFRYTSMVVLPLLTCALFVSYATVGEGEPRFPLVPPPEGDN